MSEEEDENIWNDCSLEEENQEILEHDLRDHP